MVDEIKRVLLKHPHQSHLSQATIDDEWQKLFYLERPNFDRAVAEYGSFVALLEQTGMEICYLPQNNKTGLDSIYTHDPLVISNRGAILCQMGKLARDGEPDAAAALLKQIGVPILGRITGQGRLEGGDVLWLDERTVAVGEGYRTNAEGIRQLGTLLGDAVDEVISVPLPHWTGADDCLHLLSMISPVDHDKAVVYSRLMPVFFRQWLLERGIHLIEVPDEEYDSMACNVLAVAPGQCVMLAGNLLTQARLEDAGVEVWTYQGNEISIKGAGGPTCLTRPLWRG
ncbi:amidinotransferase [Chloroflexi bacterium TSY]|nr:amidinotransferase [Chloroflexi bacterium TSY]